jgi:hypothetical protein
MGLRYSLGDPINWCGRSILLGVRRGGPEAVGLGDHPDYSAATPEDYIVRWEELAVIAKGSVGGGAALLIDDS